MFSPPCRIRVNVITVGFTYVYLCVSFPLPSAVSHTHGRGKFLACLEIGKKNSTSISSVGIPSVMHYFSESAVQTVPLDTLCHDISVWYTDEQMS